MCNWYKLPIQLVMWIDYNNSKDMNISLSIKLVSNPEGGSYGN